MEEVHQKKLEDDVNNWEDMYPKQTKYSTKMLNDQKILNGLIKMEQ
jgi:hypothetical protein